MDSDQETMQPTGKVSRELDIAVRMAINASHNQIRELKRLLSLEQMDIFPGYRAQEQL